MPLAARPTRGFTLIELVVTLTVVALVAGVAVPAMIRLSEPTDAGALEPLRTLLVDARRAAGVSGETVEVSLVPASGRYTVEQRGAAGTADVRQGVLPLRGARARGDERFRVVFRPVGIGVGDTIRAGGVTLAVAAVSGEVTVLR